MSAIILNFLGMSFLLLVLGTAIMLVYQVKKDFQKVLLLFGFVLFLVVLVIPFYFYFIIK